MFQILLAAFLAYVVGGLLLTVNVITVSLAVAIILAPLVFLRTRIYFMLFILFRPALDMYANLSLGGTVNINTFFTLLLIAVCVVEIVKRPNLERIFANRALMRINQFLFVFLFLNVFSLVYSSKVLLSLFDYVRVVSVLVSINYVAVAFPGRNQQKRLLLLVVLSSLIPIALGFYQILGRSGNLFTAGYNRILGPFIHPNVFAQYLLVVLFSAMLLIPKIREKRFLFFASLGLIILVLFSIYHTYTRGVWVALVFGMFLYVMIGTSPARKVVYLLLFILGVAAAFPFVSERWQSAFVSSRTEMSSWDWRLKQWQDTLPELTEHPVLGNGLGMYEYNSGVMAHNDYLRIGYESGLLGLGCYLLMLLYLLLVSFGRAVKRPLSEDNRRYKVTMCLVACLIVMSIVDNFVRSTVVFFYYFVVITLPFCCAENPSREKARSLS